MEWAQWIGGERQSASGPERDLINPATDEKVGSIREASASDVDRAVGTAAAALEGEWSASTPRERSELLLTLADLIEERAEEFVRLEIEDTGKPSVVMREGELPFALDNLRFFAGAARSLTGTGAGRFSKGYLSILTKHPVGVVGQIVPWNFPLIMAIWKMAPALAAGCTVVLKPSSDAPRSTLLLAELTAAAGFPPGVANVVTGTGTTGEALVDHPAVRMISLTGSTETGRRVMQRAAITVKRVHLELGGKAPAIVFADADLDSMAAGTVMGGTYNSGQDCTAATRIYAHRSIFDEAVEAVAETLARVTPGMPDDPETDIGPLISASHRQTVEGFVQRAVESGAKVVLGGQRPDLPGFFYRPALITQAAQSSEIVQGEVFGPVLTLLPFESEEEAIALANDVPYGLAASAWTRDIGRALHLSERLEFGAVWINDHLPIASEAPHGGFKQSGFGKELSEEGVLEYTVTKHTMIKQAEPEPREGFRPA